VQEEAPTLGKPVLVVRDTTERPEGIQAGTCLLIGTNENDIVKKVEEFLKNKTLYAQMCAASNPYGDGKASQRIVERLQYESNIQ
jgi:UDP-N-acetylglucosamine 2-epimerase (non-hydrolysing)